MSDSRGDVQTRLQRFWLSKTTLVLTRRGAFFDGVFAFIFWFHWDRPLASVFLLAASLVSAGMSVYSWRVRREDRLARLAVDGLD